MSLFAPYETKDKVDDATYARREAKLRADLLDVQYDVLERKAFPVIILVNGVEGAGKGETVNLLNEWMDPRHIQAFAWEAPSKEERARPEMWRFWRALPSKGRVGMFFGNWYTHPIVARVEEGMSESELDRYIERIVAFEKLLENDGALLLKFWFHLSKGAQKKRLHALENDKRTRWRVADVDWRRFKHYDAYANTSEHVLRNTSVSPWHIVNGYDANKRSLDVGEMLLKAMKRHLVDYDKTHAEKQALIREAERAKSKVGRAAAKKAETKGEHGAPASENLDILRSLKFKERLSKERYEVALDKEQARLNRLTRDPKFVKKHSCVLVFEGNDAAGKGGAVRRITSALDARQYHVIPIAAPTSEERSYPYLWRFWKQLPTRGKLTIYDRSWYGRVLVERVEGFALTEEWQRAYGEIETFEKDLVEHGMVVVKFWLAVSKDEQLRRFEEREETRFKRFKITEEDWRNRKQWGAYEAAAADMIARTSGVAAWNVIEANDKHLARIRILKAISSAIEEAL
jgi:polyphosphate:AMP phosphotransferase